MRGVTATRDELAVSETPGRARMVETAICVWNESVIAGARHYSVGSDTCRLAPPAGDVPTVIRPLWNTMIF
jgi:hypothetical protein